jgi:iron complex transport system substrate-binding protein
MAQSKVETKNQFDLILVFREGRENRPRSRHCNRLLRKWRLEFANREFRGQPKVRKPTRLVEADTLREKECGEAPRSVREAFLFGEIFLTSRLKLAILAVMATSLFLVCASPARCAAAGNTSRMPRLLTQDSGKAASKPATKIVTDETGRQVTVPVKIQRIVSLAPNLTEIVYALGLEGKLAGDTTYCDMPAAAKEKPHVGAPVNPSLEAIVALHPDLVLATTAINRRETVESLARLGIAAYTTDPHTVRGMLESIALLGDLIGVHEQGAALVAKLQMTLDDLQTHLRERPLVHVLFVVWEDPLITIGQNTFIADALRYAGAESVIISKQDWPQISMEEVLRLEPEYIVLTSNHSEIDDSDQIRDLRARPVWNQIEAVKLGRIVVTGEEITRPAPGLVEAIVQMAHELHPELFPPSQKDSYLQKQRRGSGAERLVACAR